MASKDSFHGMAAKSDFQPQVYTKMAAKMRTLFNAKKIFDAPVRVVTDQICIDELNRGGQALDLQYLHCSLVPQQEKDGFDALRPKAGVLKKLTDPAQLQRQIRHNRETP